VSCGFPLWGISIYEANDSCAARIIRLPHQNSYFVPDVILYFLEGFASKTKALPYQWEKSGDETYVTISEEQLKKLPGAVQTSFIKYSEDGSVRELFDSFRSLSFSQDYLGHYAPSSYEAFLAREPFFKSTFPPEVSNSWQLSEDKKWRRKILPFSSVKGLKRVIYRKVGGLALSIAITFDKGAVREVEVAENRNSNVGNWVFYAYDSDGKLMPRSTFYTASGHHVEAAVPYSCLTCHYHSTLRVFSRVPSHFASGGNITQLLERFR
jgi:hypothetical protein